MPQRRVRDRVPWPCLLLGKGRYGCRFSPKTSTLSNEEGSICIKRLTRTRILDKRPLRDEHNSSTACNDADPCPTLRTGVHRIYLAAPLDAQARTAVQTGL